MDRRKGLQQVERLLKQGKLQAALGELQRVSEKAPNDLLTLNRLGDLLARQGRNAEAIDYYNKIARQFATGGFVPKAIAIHKKILRLDPQNLESIVSLGELYIHQNLLGEARNYLLHAANQYLQAQDFDRARVVYRKLVEADPDDIRHRVRLAEAHAAAGESDAAGEELAQLGRSLLDAGKPVEAEKLYARANELLSDSPVPVLGLASCLSEQGHADQAVELLEEAVRESRQSPALVGELALRYESGGRGEEALALLETSPVLEIRTSVWQGLLGKHLNRGTADQLWQRLDPVFQAQVAKQDSQPYAVLLEQLAEQEEHGHVPALQRLLSLQKSRGDVQGTQRALEWLVRAYRGRSMHDEASLMLDELREIAPESHLVSPSAAPAPAPVPAPLAESAPQAAAATTAGGAPDTPAVELSPEAEAPPVPLNRADEEFVAGRLTQAEVLEKYGLRPQALEQLEEVTGRFPGHVAAQETRVKMLRGLNDKQRLGEALAQLAIALRAEGDAQSGRQAAEEAAASAELPAETCGTLRQLGLLASDDSDAADAGVDLVIDFDGAGEAAVTVAADRGTEGAVEGAPATPPASPAAAPAPAAASAGPARGARPTRVPSDDMLEEIHQLVAQGSSDEAMRRVEALGVLGYASPALESLAEQIRLGSGPAETDGVVVLDDAAAPSDEIALEPPEDHLPEVSFAEPAASAPVAGDGNGEARLEGIDDDDDLRAITEALESELFDAGVDPIVPEEDPEQSIDEIFATFKEQVKQEVDSEDYQTHYDLGIAYKEMGLVDEAISEFRLATKSPDLFREGCSMIAMCHRDRVEMNEAADWYRQAIEAPGGEPESINGLRYDLAEVLLESGDTEGALQQFRSLMDSDPAFRDVSGRISDLEAALSS